MKRRRTGGNRGAAPMLEMKRPRRRETSLPVPVSLLFVVAGALVQISQASGYSEARQASSAFSGESLSVLPDVPVDSNLRLHETVNSGETQTGVEGRMGAGLGSGRSGRDTGAASRANRPKYIIDGMWAVPTLLRDVEPVYPNQARASAIEGTVMVNLHVTEKGGVDSVGVYQSSGSRLLDEAGLDAGLKSTFIPAQHEKGRPVAMWVRRPYRFSLGPVYYFDEISSRWQDRSRIIAPPLPLGYTPPEYPEGSRKKGEEGTVVLGIWLRKDGTVSVQQFLQSSGYSLLDSAALSASFKSEFAPARDSAGTPTNAWVVRTVKFSLKRNR